MVVKAMTSFCGVPYSMAPGETKNIPEGEVLNDLLNAGLVEPVAPGTDKEQAVQNESKRRNRRDG